MAVHPTNEKLVQPLLDDSEPVSKGCMGRRLDRLGFLAMGTLLGLAATLAGSSAVHHVAPSTDLMGLAPSLRGSPTQLANYLNLASYVKPVKLFFDNQCFVRRQQAAERRLLESYVASSSLVIPPSPLDAELFQQGCRAWVAQTTDAVWHAVSDKDRDEAMDLYFTEDFTSTGFGLGMEGVQTFHGREELKKAVRARRALIPDLRIRILNTLCTPAIHDDLGLLGFFTTMPDMSTGSYVLPSGEKRPVVFFGVAVSFVYLNPKNGRWQYRGEMVMHDDLTMMAELGRAPVQAMGQPQVQELFQRMQPYFENCSLPEPYYGTK